MKHEKKKNPMPVVREMTLNHHSCGRRSSAFAVVDFTCFRVACLQDDVY